jgi:hypothetical protein
MFLSVIWPRVIWGEGEGEGRGLSVDLDNRPPVLEFSHDGGSLSICSSKIGNCDKAAFRFYLTPHLTNSNL